MPHGQKNKQTIKQKKYCNKFNKDFKNVRIKKHFLPPPPKKKISGAEAGTEEQSIHGIGCG